MSDYTEPVEKTLPPGFERHIRISGKPLDKSTFWAEGRLKEEWAFLPPKSLRREGDPRWRVDPFGMFPYQSEADLYRAAWRFWTHCALRKVRVQWAEVAPPFPPSAYFAVALDVEKVEYGNKYVLLAMSWITIHKPEPIWRFLVGWIAPERTLLILPHNTIYNGHDADQAMASFAEAAVTNLALRMED